MSTVFTPKLPVVDSSQVRPGLNRGFLHPNPSKPLLDSSPQSNSPDYLSPPFSIFTSDSPLLCHSKSPVDSLTLIQDLHSLV